MPELNSSFIVHPSSFRFLAFLRCELLMHVKSWRLWLCLGVLLAATVPWKLLLLPEIDSETLDQIADSYLQIHRTDWLLFLPVMILITVDAVGRVRVVGVHPFLFTKPFSPLSLLLACWMAVVIVAALLAGPTLFVRYLIGRFHFGLTLPIAPFGWLLGLAAIPTAMGLAAVVIWVRTVVKHNVPAYLVSAILGGALLGATNAYDLPFLGWNQELIRPLVQQYIPVIGRDLDWQRYGEAFGNTALLSLLFVSFACYYMRRQEPQRAVWGDYGRNWTDVPTFLGFLSDLRPDGHVGIAVHFVFLSSAVLASLVGLRWMAEYKVWQIYMNSCATDLRYNLDSFGKAAPGLMIRHYSGDIAMRRRDYAQCELRMEIANTTQTAVEQVAMMIPFGMGVLRIDNERPEISRQDAYATRIEYRQLGNIVVARLPSPLDPGSTTTIHLSYQGYPMVLQIGNRKPETGADKVRNVVAQMKCTLQRWAIRLGIPDPWPHGIIFGSDPRWDIEVGHLDDVGLLLGSRYVQVNGWLLPKTVTLTNHPFYHDLVPVEMPRLFTADLQVGLPADLVVVSPDGPVERLRQEGDLFYSRLRIEWPRGDFALFAGPYEKIEKTFGPLSLRVQCFPADREIIRFALRELDETVERWGLIFGSLKGGSCVLVEAPASYRAEDRLPPGILAASDLDRLRRYRPLLDKRQHEGYDALDVYQSKLSAALAGRIIRDSFHPDAQIRPLREALYNYLIGTVQRSELGPNSRKSARLFQQRRVGNLIAFLDPVRAAQFNTPLVQRFTAPTFGGNDAMHIWRMVHYLLDDDKFAALLRSLVSEYGDRIVTLADLCALAERVQGSSLDWFFKEWFFGAGAPKYEILEARATMTENERTRDIEYDVRIVVANRGKGRMPVPIVLQTEHDRITRMVWLDSATTQTVMIHVPDRPETVFMDPEGWITQATTPDRETRTRGPAWRRVRILE